MLGFSRHTKTAALLAFAALALGAAASFAADEPLLSAKRASCAVHAGVAWNRDSDGSFLPEADTNLLVALAPSFSTYGNEATGVSAALVCPTSLQVAARQLAIEPGLSVGWNSFQARASYGFFRDLDGDHGVENAREWVAGASVISAPAKRASFVLTGRYGLASQQTSVSARVSYIIFDGGTR